MTSTINRRSFLKWAAAAGGTAALSSSLLCTTACSADAAAEGASDITANVTDAISDGNPYGEAPPHLPLVGGQKDAHHLPALRRGLPV